MSELWSWLVAPLITGGAVFLMCRYEINRAGEKERKKQQAEKARMEEAIRLLQKIRQEESEK